MFKKIKGFTDFDFHGHPVWIRDEYEKVYKDKSELERLSDYLGYYPKSLDMVISKARNLDCKLVYKRYSQFIDNGLENKYGKGKFQWVPYRKGYINLITYEYIPNGNKPDDSGTPFWSKKVHLSYQSAGEYQSGQMQELLLYLLTRIFVR